MSQTTRNLIILAAVLVAVALLVPFVDAFVAWNKEQACATSGGRRCAERIVPPRGG